MKIVLCSDDNYAKHMASTMESIIVNSSKKHDFVVLWTTLKYEIRQALLLHFQSKVNSIQFIELKAEMLSEIPKPKIESHFSISAYLRIFIPLVLPNEDKVLYIDSDMIVREDIIELMTAPEVINGNYGVYAVEEVYDYIASLKGYKMKIVGDMSIPLLNSGLLIIDIIKWREEDYIRKMMFYIENNPTLLEFVDQDALNNVFKGNFGAIHPRWNMGDIQFNPVFKGMSICYTSQQIDDAILKPAVIHFTWKHKPWKYLCNHKYKKEYWKYRRLTPWNDYRLEDKTLRNMFRKHTPSFFLKLVKYLKLGQRVKLIFRLIS